MAIDTPAATPFFGSTLRTWRLADVCLTETRHPAGERLAAHSHEAPFVTFVLQGGYHESRNGTSSWCGAGCAVTHEAGEEHADRFGPAATHLLNVEWDGGEHEGPVFQPRVLEGPAPRRIAAALFAELGSRDSATRLAIESLLAEITMLDYAVPSDRAAAPSWLIRVNQRIRDEYRSPPGLDELAREAGVHRSHLARCFRRYYRRTIGDLVRELRVGWAKERLLRGAPLAETAIEAGFADQSHMNRWFRRLLGRLPGSLRS